MNKINEIDNYFKNELKALEVKDSTYFGLIKDEFVDCSKIVKLYKINDLAIKGFLYNEEEKHIQEELANEYIDYELLPDINIAIESEDNIVMSGYTIQGECEALYKILASFY